MAVILICSCIKGAVSAGHRVVACGVEPAVDPPRGDGGARGGPGEHEGDAARVRPAPARARQTVRHHAGRGKGGGGRGLGALWGDRI